MFIPYQVDAPYDHRPVMHWLILLGVVGASIFALEAPEQIERFGLDGWGIGLVSYSFLHVNIVHLIGNLLFLWPFGNAVCSKIGNGAYLVVYLLLGILGGVIHILLGGAAAFGAGVVINGVVGMYIVFFPENSINCFFFLPRPVSVSILGYWIVLLWIIFDISAAAYGVRGVNYTSHIFGLVAGFGLGVLMLKRKWVVMERDEKSLLQKLSREKEEAEEEKKEKEKEAKAAGVVGEEKKAVEKEKETLAGESAVVEAESAEEGFIRFSCQCGKKIKVPRGYAGKSGRCPRCRKVVEVPHR